ncbi:MAG: hypothetical protein QOI66_1522 [Myxococcales bacterium]|jgi:hypothetical protein|nr:hypothetical protein [Myxococcales bacterium]
MSQQSAIGRAAGLMLMTLICAGCAASSGSNGYGNPGSGSGGSSGFGTGGNSGSGGSSGAGGAVGSGGSTAAGSGGAASDGSVSPDASSDASGVDGGPTLCFLEVISLSMPQITDPFERRGMPYRVRGKANVSEPTDTWAWDVTTPDGTVNHPQSSAGDPAIVEFPVPVSGTYVITGRISTRPACGFVTRPVTVIDPQPAAFTFRVLPPASLPSPVQEFQRTRQQLSGGLDMISQVQHIRIFPRDNTAQPLPAYMQITSPGSKVIIEGNTQRGAMNVDLIQQRNYDLLLIPAGNFAPILFNGLPSDLANLANSTLFDAGIKVSGQALRASGTPVTDARLVLREGTRPSTVGISDSGGAFSLFTREGNLSVEIAAPPDSGLPDGHVDAGAGFALARNAAGPTLTMRWAALPAGALKLTIRSADGATVVARATVHVELATPIAAAGQLTVHAGDGSAAADRVLPVSGSVHADAVGDDKGIVTFPALTAGSYRVTVVPPATAGATAAITAATVDVVAAGVTRDVRIAQTVTLTGTLQPAATSKGVRITAIDTGGDIVTSTVSTLVGDGGRYQLVVNPGRSYKLWAVPGADQLFARAVLGTVQAPMADQALPTFTLAAGIATASSVRAGGPVADALVQVFCPRSSPTCLDMALPIAEAVTDLNGQFTVILPDVGP